MTTSTLTAPAVEATVSPVRRGPYPGETWGQWRREADKKPRVYVWIEDETVLENLVNRRSRPVEVYRAVALQALTDLGIPFEKIRWSQKAGCSCPCSPGFIVDGPYQGGLPRGSSLHLTVRAAV